MVAIYLQILYHSTTTVLYLLMSLRTAVIVIVITSHVFDFVFCSSYELMMENARSNLVFLQKGLHYRL